MSRLWCASRSARGCPCTLCGERMTQYTFFSSGQRHRADNPRTRTVTVSTILRAEASAPRGHRPCRPDADLLPRHAGPLPSVWSRQTNARMWHRQLGDHVLGHRPSDRRCSSVVVRVAGGAATGLASGPRGRACRVRYGAAAARYTLVLAMEHSTAVRIGDCSARSPTPARRPGGFRCPIRTTRQVCTTGAVQSNHGRKPPGRAGRGFDRDFLHRFAPNSTAGGCRERRLR